MVVNITVQKCDIKGRHQVYLGKAMTLEGTSSHCLLVSVDMEGLLLCIQGLTTQTQVTHCWAVYLVASSDISAILDMFLATTLVLCEAAMNQAGEPGTCRAPEICVYVTVLYLVVLQTLLHQTYDNHIIVTIMLC